MDATPSVNDEDVVEASDSEELEILLAERQAAQIQPSLVLRTSSFESGTPRKRRKVWHIHKLASGVLISCHKGLPFQLQVACPHRKSNHLCCILRFE